MKNRVIAFVAILTILAGNLFAQNQAMVSVSVTATTATTITANFQKNAACTNYTILAAEAQTMEEWAALMQTSLSSLVEMWGIGCPDDTLYIWADLTPATDYNIYVSVHGDRDTLISLPVQTSSVGGHGASVISIEVAEIGDDHARVICTPNSETSMFKDLLITVAYFNEIGTDSALALVKDDFYTHYEVDDWVWSDLQQGTPYYALAVGLNVDSLWGEMAIKQFSTTGTASIADVQTESMRLFPNPATDFTELQFSAPLQSSSTMYVFDLNGRQRLSSFLPAGSTSLRISTRQLDSGVYLLRVAGNGTCRSLRLVKTDR